MAASRKLHEEARRVLLAHSRLMRDFDESERAFYQACELPDVERSNRERREGRPVPKNLAHTNPARERTRVLLTFPLVVGAAKTIDNVIGDHNDKLALKAALGLAYGLSLRPREFLKLSGASQRKPQEQTMASHAFLWWDGKAYPVTDPKQFPAGPAQFFTLRVDFLKQDQTGKGMPRAVAAPSHPCEFSCVNALENYFRAVRRGTLSSSDKVVNSPGRCSAGSCDWSLRPTVLTPTDWSCIRAGTELSISSLRPDSTRPTP
jgi:hypothetical protein